MTNVHDFIKCLNEIIDECFPNTTRYVISGEKGSVENKKATILFVAF